MKKLLLSIVLMLAISCNGKLHLGVEEKDSHYFSLTLSGSSTVSDSIMSYFEDLDLLQEVTPRSDGLPSAFDEMLVFIRPYVSMARVDRLKGNQLRYQLDIENLLVFQKRFQQDGYQLIQFYQDDSKQYHLRLAVSPVELNLLYDSMSMLPKVPTNWNRSNRKNYIQQLANVFGATKNERSRLEQELDLATMHFSIALPKHYKNITIESKSGRVSGNGAEIAINVIDFLAGQDYIEVIWS